MDKRRFFITNYSINEPIADTVFKGPDKITRLNEASNLSGYWESARLSPLNQFREGTLYNRR